MSQVLILTETISVYSGALYTEVPEGSLTACQTAAIFQCRTQPKRNAMHTKIRKDMITTCHRTFFRIFHSSSAHKSQRRLAKKVEQYRPNTKASANTTPTSLSSGVSIGTTVLVEMGRDAQLLVYGKTLYLFLLPPSLPSGLPPTPPRALRSVCRTRKHREDQIRTEKENENDPTCQSNGEAPCNVLSSQTQSQVFPRK